MFSKTVWTIWLNINVKVNLSNYATKTDIKNISHGDTSSFALKPNLDSLNTEVDKLDVNKLASVPADLINAIPLSAKYTLYNDIYKLVLILFILIGT